MRRRISSGCRTGIETSRSRTRESSGGKSTDFEGEGNPGGTGRQQPEFFSLRQGFDRQARIRLRSCARRCLVAGEEEVDQAAKQPKEDDQEDADEAVVVGELLVLHAVDERPDPEDQVSDPDRDEDEKDQRQSKT